MNSSHPSTSQINHTKGLIRFIRNSPTQFHTIENIKNELYQSGFLPLDFSKGIKKGENYYFTQNGSCIIALSVPADFHPSFMVTASHSDSPMFKIKTNGILKSNEYSLLNTEPYGGTIYSTWFDRPLSVAGRAIIKKDSSLQSCLFDSSKDTVLIPSVAIHLNRSANSGYSYNPAIDLRPVIGSDNVDISSFITSCISEEKATLVSYDAYVYNRMPGTIWGNNSEFFSSPRIDNLQSVFTSFTAFVNRKNATTGSIKIFSVFDNEETGSVTKQGAGSNLLSEIINYVCNQLSLDKRKALSDSMMLSIDNGHAIHPNHPELYDLTNSPQINHGVVIKYAASQKYATDSYSSAVFQDILNQYQIPYQYYHNRSDLPGGSTLGSIADTHLPITTVDIGIAQLAMHSSFETAGTMDTESMINACTAFYSTVLDTQENNIRLSYID